MHLNKVNTYIAFAIGISTVLGSVLAIDSRYAKQSQVQDIKKDIKAVDERLENKILRDKADYLQEMIWKMEDRYDGKEMPSHIKDTVRRWQKEHDAIVIQLISPESS